MMPKIIGRIAVTDKTCRCWGKYKPTDPECEICKATLECEFEQLVEREP
jgi:hypothetical protein